MENFECTDSRTASFTKLIILIQTDLGVYVNINGCRSRVEEIMWPSRPISVTFMDPYLLCFCDRGVDVFHVKTSEWIQILQLPRTKPLDKTGTLCLANESQDSIRLVHLKPSESDEIISLLTKSRSLVKSKLRKGSLSRTDDTYLSLVNTARDQSLSGQQQAQFNNANGSTSLNYSNSAASQANSAANTTSTSSRKSLISNPINFQHRQHMGPSDGKSFMTTDLPPINRQNLNVSSLNTSGLDSSSNQPKKTSSSSISNRQIAKKEISGPTNFRHVVRGLEEFGFNTPMTKESISKAQSLSASRLPAGASTMPVAGGNGPPNVPPPPLPSTNHISIKSSSLSSSSSSSSSILHSPHSPSSANNENLSQAISNTLKANSVLYNGRLWILYSICFFLIKSNLVELTNN